MNTDQPQSEPAPSAPRPPISDGEAGMVTRIEELAYELLSLIHI